MVSETPGKAVESRCGADRGERNRRRLRRTGGRAAALGIWPRRRRRCVQGWLGDWDTCLSTDIPLENDRDYVMSLLAVLSGGSRRAAYQVEELGGSVCENGYSIPKVQFSRKENEK